MIIINGKQSKILLESKIIPDSQLSKEIKPSTWQNFIIILRLCLSLYPNCIKWISLRKLSYSNSFKNQKSKTLVYPLIRRSQWLVKNIFIIFYLNEGWSTQSIWISSYLTQFFSIEKLRMRFQFNIKSQDKKSTEQFF